MEVPEGEVSVLLGPSGTGKSVFLKSLIGLLRPERGSIIVDGTDITECSAKELYEIRTLFGVMFQDGALFGSMNLYDNTAFPLREHTKKRESEIRDIVMEKLNMGMLFRRKLVMFGPREVLLTSDEPVVKQFLNGRRIGPIGMSEEKDEATMAEEQAHLEAGHVDGGVEEIEGVPPQIVATPGMPERKAVGRRQARVRENLHLLPKDAQEAIRESLDSDGNQGQRNDDERARHRDEEPDTASIPTQRSR